MPKLIKYFLIAIIFFSFLFCLWLPLHGELIIQTDIARDLLLMEEIVQTHKLPLIGAHSGIAGIYHGPLWFYINLPFFIIGHGNPAIVGVFWAFLYSLSLIILFYVARYIFDSEIALLSTALYAMVSVQEVNNLSNPYGALIIFPLFFYLFYRYIKSLNIKYALLAFLTLGLMIQFQMAFGIPILILTLLYFLIFLLKKHKLTHSSSILVLLLTQSTTLLFELRHNFLEYHSFMNYLKNHSSNFPNILNIIVLTNQLIRSINEGLVFFTKNNLYLDLIFFIAVVISLVYIWKKKKLQNKIIYLLFLYYYFGYWFMMLLYHDKIWIYYHWAFIPVLIILFASSYKIVNGKIFLPLYFIFIGILFFQQINRFVERNNYIGLSQASWKFIKSSADAVYNDTPGDFGYYVVSDDQLGYQAKYAFHYLQQFHKNKAFSFQKRPITYAYLVPSSDRGFNYDNFVRERIKINTLPTKVIKFGNGVKINKYEILVVDLTTPSDENLLDSLIFR